MEQLKPPSSQSRSDSSLFFVGKDRRGNWVVQDQKCLRGGLFINRKEALKFAMFENGNQPQAVVMFPGILELNVNGKTGTKTGLMCAPVTGSSVQSSSTAPRARFPVVNWSGPFGFDRRCVR